MIINQHNHENTTARGPGALERRGPCRGNGRVLPWLPPSRRDASEGRVGGRDPGRALALEQSSRRAVSLRPGPAPRVRDRGLGSARGGDPRRGVRASVAAATPPLDQAREALATRRMTTLRGRSGGRGSVHACRPSMRVTARSRAGRFLVPRFFIRSVCWRRRIECPSVRLEERGPVKIINYYAHAESNREVASFVPCVRHRGPDRSLLRSGALRLALRTPLRRALAGSSHRLSIAVPSRRCCECRRGRPSSKDCDAHAAPAVGGVRGLRARARVRQTPAAAGRDGERPARRGVRISRVRREGPRERRGPFREARSSAIAGRRVLQPAESPTPTRHGAVSSGGGWPSSSGISVR